MKRFPKVIILFVVVMILSFVAVSFAGEAKKKAAPKKPKKLKVGDTIMDFSLPDGISKSIVSFQNDIKGKGKVILISFMTTACSACKAEITLLSDLANKYGEDVRTYAISVDLNGEKSIPAYDKTFGFNIKYLLDPEFSIPQVFGFSYTPGLIIANSTGKIIFLKGGYVASAAEEIIQIVKDNL
jgi:peroxiredoxin